MTEDIAQFPQRRGSSSPLRTGPGLESDQSKGVADHNFEPTIGNASVLNHLMLKQEMGEADQQHLLPYASFLQDSSFNLDFNPLALSFDPEGQTRDSVHDNHQRHETFPISTQHNKTASVSSRKFLDTSKSRLDEHHADQGDEECSLTTQKRRSTPVVEYAMAQMINGSIGLNVQRSDAHVEENSTNLGRHVDDLDTAMKEKRGVVKRRSTPRIMSHIPLPSSEISEVFDGGDINRHVAMKGMAPFAIEPVQAVPLYLNQPQPLSPPVISPESQLPEPRPESSISNHDEALFNDFDGVHYNPPTTLSSLPLSQLQRTSFHPQTQLTIEGGKNLVYYPAPVPMMLNLPPRLSQIHKRDGLSQIRPHSLAFPSTLNAQDTTTTTVSQEGTDRPSRQLNDSGVKSVSALATFASILDAAAAAPPSSLPTRSNGHSKRAQRNHVSQHNKAMHLSHNDGSERIDFYSSQILDRNEDQTLIPRLVHSRIALQPNENGGLDGVLQAGSHDKQLDNDTHGALCEDLAPHDDDGIDERDSYRYRSRTPSPGASEFHEFEDATPASAPSTLIAELEARKTKQRLRTQATPLRFGAGLRSTLLELDAVAEVQRQARRKLPTTLSWQDNEFNESTETMDEDVPLGVLYAGALNVQRSEPYRQPGLLAKREMEDNEPLSRRRERLRSAFGYPQDRNHGTQPEPLRASTFTLDLPDMGQHLQMTAEKEGEGGDEDETLAQRRARLNAAPGLQRSPSCSDEISKVVEVDEEETLAQRRQRLKYLQDMQGTQHPPYIHNSSSSPEGSGPISKRMASMSDLLHANPQRQSYLPNVAAVPVRGLLSADLPTGYHAQQQQQQQLEMLMQTQKQYPYNQQIHHFAQNFGSLRQYPQPYDISFAGNYHGRTLNTMHLVQPTFVDQKSREMVERWRTSVL